MTLATSSNTILNHHEALSPGCRSRSAARMTAGTASSLGTTVVGNAYQAPGEVRHDSRGVIGDIGSVRPDTVLPLVLVASFGPRASHRVRLDQQRIRSTGVASPAGTPRRPRRPGTVRRSGNPRSPAAATRSSMSGSVQSSSGKAPRSLNIPRTRSSTVFRGPGAQ